MRIYFWWIQTNLGAKCIKIPKKIIQCIFGTVKNRLNFNTCATPAINSVKFLLQFTGSFQIVTTFSTFLIKIKNKIFYVKKRQEFKEHYPKF